MLPSPALLDTRTPPESGRSVEIEKPTATAARGLFEQKMSIQENCLHTGEQRIAPIQMSPPRLNHSDVRVGEKMDGLFKQVFLWNKIGVEYAKKFAFCRSETHRQCASLEAGAISPMNALYIKAALTQFLRTCGRDLACLVC